MKALPNWERWQKVDSLLLEECVALSLDRDPVGTWTVTDYAVKGVPLGTPSRAEYREFMAKMGRQLPAAAPVSSADPREASELADAVRWRTRREWSHPALTEDEGRARLQVLRECFDNGSAFLPPATAAKPGQRAQKRVRIEDFARFAASQGWQIPGPLAALANAPHAPVYPKGFEPANTPTMIKKAALIKRVIHEWPTVERDLSEASRNGLSAAKGDAHGMWCLEVAMTWARSRDKLATAVPLRSGLWHAPRTTKAKRSPK